MTNSKRKLLALAMGVFVSAGAFAQKKGDDKRPPKDRDTKVVVREKEREKPPRNDNQPPQKDKRRGKP